MPNRGTYTFKEDDITGIESAKVEESERLKTQTCYDLQGRKVSGTVKGNIYIRNHHKILVK
jgi:hypothetical protein